MQIGVLIGVLLALVGFLVTLYIFQTKRRDERINSLIQNFFNSYQGGGYILEHLIPAGINNLKNDKEIKEALEKLRQRLGGTHPLRNWNEKIEKIGYKKFFNFMTQSKKELNKSTIGVAITTIKFKL